MVTPNDDGTYDVAFTYYGEAERVWLCSSLPGVGWSTSSAPVMDQDSPGVWTTTVHVSTPGTYHYKFLVNYDNGWTPDQNNSFKVKDNNALVAVGYENPSIEENVVTIRYIPTNGENKVEIAGNFDGTDVWKTITLEPDKNGVCAHTFTGIANTNYQYRFIIDGIWVSDPANKNALAGDNSQFTFVASPEATSTPEPVDPKTIISPEIDGNHVTFRYYSENATEVKLAGTVTSWGGVLMDSDGNGLWTMALDLLTGNYEYKFIDDSVSGTWPTDPQNPYRLTSSGNSFLPVGYQSPVVNGTSVTISYYDPSADPGTVKVAGSMTNWATDAVLMTDDGKGLFTCTIDDLAPGDYQYQIIIVTGSDSQAWHQDPANTAALTGEYNNNQFKINEVVEPDPEETTTPDPTATPTPDPTATPSTDPTATPTPDPTATPSTDPTATPTPGPTETPSPDPTETPSTTPEPAEVISPEVSDNAVTFRYEDSGANDVWLKGSLNGWAPERMTPGDNGVWSITKELAPGGYTYKFLVNDIENGWVNDPKNPYQLTGSTGDNFVPVGYQSPIVDGANATITYHNTSDQSIEIAGDMTDWKFVEMTPGADGLCSHTFENLTKGQHLYKLHIVGTGDEGWFLDPANPQEPVDGNNPFDVENGVEPDPAPDPAPKPTAILSPEVSGNTVTFRYEAPSAGSVKLAGSMTGWGDDPKEMKKDDSTGIWSITLEGLETGTYQYKFIVDDQPDWLADPKNPFNANNNGNSFVTIGYSNPIIDGSNVTIRYQTKNNNDSSVQVAGSMPESNWIGKDMVLGDDGVYTYTFKNLPNGTYQYKLIVDGKWVADPSNPSELVSNDKNSQFTVTESSQQQIISPEVTGHEVTIRYPGTATSVELMGTLPGADWTIDKNPPLKENQETGIWEIILEDVPAGKYQYKFAVNGSWTMDSLNPWTEGDNNIVVVTGLRAPTGLNAQTGTAYELPEALDLYTADGDSSKVPVEYTLKVPNDAVKLEGNVLTVPDRFDGTSIELTATYSDETVDVTVGVFTQLYTYNVYFFDWNSSRVDTSAADIWLWYAGEGGAAQAFTSTETIDGKTWLKAVLQVPVTTINLIVRAKDTWDAWKTQDFTSINSDGPEAVNVYVYNNKIAIGKPPVLPAEQGREFFVPGTFPGPSWDAASNQMEVFDPENKIYAFTFENVPPATYEFKIAVNGEWDPENYGTNGEVDGSNYSVTVPQQMNVTVYYSDVTHLAVTNLNYRFVKPFVTGQGLDTPLALNDAGLTGIYSGKVSLKAGHYENLALQISEDMIGTYPEFTLDTDRDITFYYSPVNDIWYNDAVEWDNTAEVYYDSKNLTYKSPFGAVPTDTPVTFAVDTASSITGVKLVVGLDQHPMVPVDGAPAGRQRWSTEVTFNSIGELKYYFLVSQAGGIKVYCDDDGYYGTGKLTELTELHPYDLIVYKKGFTTPDWMKEAVVYQIFPDRFFNADTTNDRAQLSARGAVNYEFPAWHLIPENPEQKELGQSEYESYGAFWGDGEWSNEIYGGDLKGITEKVNYLRDLGVTVIYLNPVFASISNHRYDTSDYTEIDPILGDLEDFRELVKAAYANGMHIILDGVFNHVSDDSIYFDRYYKYLDAGTTKIGAYPYWAYVYDYMKDNGVSQSEAEKIAEEYFRTEYHITDFSYTTWFDISSQTGTGKDTIGHRIGKPVYTYQGWWGYDSMPVIKSTNGSEFQTVDWAEDVITSKDSITRYWLKQGSNGWRLDVANEVSDETWQNFRDVVKDTGDCVIIGEIWDDATKYLMGDMYDSVMNYMFRNAVTNYAKGGSAEQATKDLERIRERYPSEAFYAMMNLVDSHDTARILSFLDGVNDDRDQKDPEHTFPQYASTSEVAKERQKLVAFLQFTYAGAPTIYYGDERGMVGADDPDDRRTIADWDSVTDPSLLAWYTQLGNLRADYSALRTGSVEPIDSLGSTVLGFVRRDTAQSIIVLANNSDNEQTVHLVLADLGMDETALQELISGSTVTVDGGAIDVTVPAYRGIVLTGDAANPEPPKPIPVPDYEAMDKEKEEESKPSQEPTTPPATDPTEEPSHTPTEQPTQVPTEEPSTEPSQEPSTPPTTEPTEEPTQTPTEQPTQAPSDEPTTPPATEEPTTPPATEDPTTPPTTEEPTTPPATEEPTTPPATEEPTTPPATQQPTPPTYYPQPSNPVTSTAPTPSASPVPSTTPASPQLSPSAPLEELPEIDTPLAGLPTTETTIRPGSAMKDGVLTAEIKDNLQDAILDHVEANKSTTVVVAPEFDEKSTRNDVILSGALMDKLADMGNVDVRVETPVGNVTIPEAALESLGTAKQVTVSVHKEEDSVTVTVKADDKALTTVPGGVKTALKLEDGQVAVLVDKDGKETVLPKSLVEDGTTYAILPGSGTVKVVSRSAVFEDVPAASWYADAVSFAATHEIFSGVSKTEMVFAPNMDVDRSMAATMLWALESKVNPKTAASFPDVATDKWYAESVAWASENGIVAGYSTGEFAPADTITREQFATMLYNYAKYLGLDTARSDRMQTFSDADTVSSWAKDAMTWAVGAGVINGNGNQQLIPKDSITRAQAAAAMQNLVSLIVK